LPTKLHAFLSGVFSLWGLLGFVIGLLLGLVLLSIACTPPGGRGRERPKRDTPSTHDAASGCHH
jgi:hypothetical protein